MEDDVVVCGEKTSAEIVAQAVINRMQCSGSSDENNEPSKLPVQPLPTSVETMDYILELRRYFEAQQNVSDTVFKSLNILQYSVVVQRLK
ncbi:hypothetical protein PR048_027801 [Dryococelus australis]|uniref:Uncharacterized protein n=1 Tax=Dryococelus australis TaxID=614101 RepID=A0ABQ9GHJ9_9NEOP|nr:hypothetical protein PR048_027801 [Dryococelus australis]